MMHIHIIGIAGAGMSAIAHLLLDQRYRVSGSDTQHNAQTAALVARGAHITLGHAIANVAGVDLVLATSAVRADHLEIAAAHAAGILVQKRADLWANWSAARPVAAVAGTHGKSTTSAMLALMLLHAGQEIGYLIGADAPDLPAPARWGHAAAPLVIEADEYDRTFLALTPDVAVVTNIEWDHVDIYPVAADVDAAFHQFVRQVRDPQRVVICADDQGALRATDLPGAVHVGIDAAIASDPVSCRRAPLDLAASSVRATASGTVFDVWHYDRTRFAMRLLGTCTTHLSGVHNVRNALCAIAAAQLLGASFAACAAGLAAYRGVGRRFEVLGDADGVLLIDDYAHHPTEVRATLAAARTRFPGRRLVVYLQPHTYSRTRALFDDWRSAFVDADLVCIGDVYAAREPHDPAITAAKLASSLDHIDARAVGSVAQAAETIGMLLQPGDVLLTLGAGDSNRVGQLVRDQRTLQTVRGI